MPNQPHPALKKEERDFFGSSFPPQAFSWAASLLAERLVEQEGIDLIEAQDYEAPLYYFQLRRALGKGPKRQPPCFVHLHSPTEFIGQHNDWDRSLPHIATAKRLEDYSIHAADALLCPSRYLARQVEVQYGLSAESISVIPLPIGDNPILEREQHTWEHGTVFYSGRLERRKGVIEWIEAAVRIAAEYPAVQFEFVGRNVLGTNTIYSENFLDRLIPANLKVRFTFHGEQNRTLLPTFLSRARIAVVPSRWENFPNTCVEAMCSGLPVIATREGGMQEMIVDGTTGWLAKRATSDDLAEACKRALERSAEELAEMGREASASIRKLCDNEKIVERQLEFRLGLVGQGPRRSLSLPANLPWGTCKTPDNARRRAAPQELSRGLNIVVVCGGSERGLHRTLSSLEQQTQSPAAVVVVYDQTAQDRVLAAVTGPQRQGWRTISHTGNMATAKNAGIGAALASMPQPLGFIFLHEGDQLHSDFIQECGRVLQHRSEVGLVSCWTSDPGAKGKMNISACPSFPYQWAANEVAPFSAVRTEALLEAEKFRTVMEDGYENWDLFNAVMAKGWVAVTIPALLGECHIEMTSQLRSPHNHIPGRMRKLLVDRFPDLIAQDTAEIILLVEANAAQAQQGNSLAFAEHLAVAYTMIRHPHKSARLVLARVRKLAHRSLARLFNPRRSEPN